MANETATAQPAPQGYQGNWMGAALNMAPQLMNSFGGGGRAPQMPFNKGGPQIAMPGYGQYNTPPSNNANLYAMTGAGVDVARMAAQRTGIDKSGYGRAGFAAANMAQGAMTGGVEGGMRTLNAMSMMPIIGGMLGGMGGLVGMATGPQAMLALNAVKTISRMVGIDGGDFGKSISNKVGQMMMRYNPVYQMISGQIYKNQKKDEKTYQEFTEEVGKSIGTTGSYVDLIRTGPRYFADKSDDPKLALLFYIAKIKSEESPWTILMAQQMGATRNNLLMKDLPEKEGFVYRLADKIGTAISETPGLNALFNLAKAPLDILKMGGNILSAPGKGIMNAFSGTGDFLDKFLFGSESKRHADNPEELAKEAGVYKSSQDIQRIAMKAIAQFAEEAYKVQLKQLETEQNILGVLQSTHKLTTGQDFQYQYTQAEKFKEGLTFSIAAQGMATKKDAMDAEENNKQAIAAIMQQNLWGGLAGKYYEAKTEMSAFLGIGKTGRDIKSAQETLPELIKAAEAKKQQDEGGRDLTEEEKRVIRKQIEYEVVERVKLEATERDKIAAQQGMQTFFTGAPQTFGIETTQAGIGLRQQFNWDENQLQAGLMSGEAARAKKGREDDITAKFKKALANATGFLGIQYEKETERILRQAMNLEQRFAMAKQGKQIEEVGELKSTQELMSELFTQKDELMGGERTTENMQEMFNVHNKIQDLEELGTQDGEQLVLMSSIVTSITDMKDTLFNKLIDIQCILEGSAASEAETAMKQEETTKEQKKTTGAIDVMYKQDTEQYSGDSTTQNKIYDFQKKILESQEDTSKNISHLVKMFKISWVDDYDLAESAATGAIIDDGRPIKDQPSTDSAGVLIKAHDGEAIISPGKYNKGFFDWFEETVVGKALVDKYAASPGVSKNTIGFMSKQKSIQSDTMSERIKEREEKGEKREERDIQKGLSTDVQKIAEAVTEEAEDPKKKEKTKDEDKSWFSKILGGIGFLTSAVGAVGSLGMVLASEGAIGAKGLAALSGKALSKGFFKNMGGKLLEKIGFKGVGKFTGKAAGKILVKTIGKSIPFMGVLVGLGFAAKRWSEGDIVGGLWELASGISAQLPVIGWGISAGIDVMLMLEDEAKAKSEEEGEEYKGGKTVISKINNFVKERLKVVKDWWGDFFYKVPIIGNFLGNLITGQNKESEDIFTKENAKSILDFSKESIINAKDMYVDIFKRVWGFIKGAPGMIFEFLKESGTSSIKFLKSALMSDETLDVKQVEDKSAPGLIARGSDFIKGLLSNDKEDGGYVNEGKGVGSAGDKVKNLLRTVTKGVDSAREKVKGPPPKKPPQDSLGIRGSINKKSEIGVGGIPDINKYTDKIGNLVNNSIMNILKSVSDSEDNISDPIKDMFKITSPIGPREAKKEPGASEVPSGMHKGVDFSTGGKSGVPIQSIVGGEVVKTGGAYHEVLIKDEATGGFQRYAHLDKINVKMGDHVRGGEIIGTSGGWGKGGAKSFTPHLHLEMLTKDKKHLNPEQLFYEYWKSGGDTNYKGEKSYTFNPKSRGYVSSDKATQSLLSAFQKQKEKPLTEGIGIGGQANLSSEMKSVTGNPFEEEDFSLKDLASELKNVVKSTQTAVQPVVVPSPPVVVPSNNAIDERNIELVGGSFERMVDELFASQVSSLSTNLKKHALNSSIS